MAPYMKSFPRILAGTSSKRIMCPFQTRARTRPSISPRTIQLPTQRTGPGPGNLLTESS